MNPYSHYEFKMGVCIIVTIAALIFLGVVWWPK